jgi:hypothetical protein
VTDRCEWPIGPASDTDLLPLRECGEPAHSRVMLFGSHTTGVTRRVDILSVCAEHRVDVERHNAGLRPR